MVCPKFRTPAPLDSLIYGPLREKTCLREPAHPCSPISAFVICFLKSIICKLATGEILIFLASICSWRDWFETRFVGNSKERFPHDIYAWYFLHYREKYQTIVNQGRFWWNTGITKCDISSGSPLFSMLTNMKKSILKYLSPSPFS